MTTDAQTALAKVREALAARPTPGPWYVRTNRHPTTDGRSWGWLDAAPPGGPQRAIAGVRVEWEDGDTSAVNARYLAACSPANIAAILAHVEAQAAEIERLRSERDSIAIENSKFMDQIERLRADLETERMRLVACGVAALANTADSAARARDILPEYRSASLDDVERTVDREIQLRDERDELRRQLDEMRAALIAAMEIVQRSRALLMYETCPDPASGEITDEIVGERDRNALAEHDAVIAQADAAMGPTTKAEES